MIVMPDCGSIKAQKNLLILLVTNQVGGTEAPAWECRVADMAVVLVVRVDVTRDHREAISTLKLVSGQWSCTLVKFCWQDSNQYHAIY